MHEVIIILVIWWVVTEKVWIGWEVVVWYVG
jgi:hypothetical protein